MTISAFPSSMDVQVSLSTAQNAQRTNLSVLCFVTPYSGAVPDKISFYTSAAQVSAAWGVNTEPAKAAAFFFSQINSGQFCVAQLSSGWSVASTEMDLINSAAATIGKSVYGIALDASLRVAATQASFATWALANLCVMPLVSNDVQAYNPGYTTDIGSVAYATGNKRVECIWHNDINMYPDVSILAYMLAVNYLQQNSTVTEKFVQLPGVTPATMTYQQWVVLSSKGYNTYTLMDNGATVFREGVNEDPSNTVYMDNVINMDNFVTDLRTSVYNVYLRNNKVPYTDSGNMMLVDACKDVGRQYKFNGTFADQQVADSSQKSGYKTVPAYLVTPTPVWQIPSSVRATRVGPPIVMVVQQAGAIHSTSINIQVVN